MVELRGGYSGFVIIIQEQLGVFLRPQKDGNPPGPGVLLEDDLHSHGQGNGEEHTHGSEDESPDNKSQKDYQGGEAHPLAHDLRLNNIPDHHVNRHVSYRGPECPSQTQLNQGE